MTRVGHLTRYSQVPLAGAVIRSREADGILLTEEVYAQGCRLEKHCHPDSYLILVIAGSFFQQFQHTAKTCNPQTMHFVPKQEPHANDYRQRSRCLDLMIPEQMVHDLGDSRKSLLQTGRIDTPAAPTILARLYREFTQWDDLSALTVHGLTIESLVECSRASLGKRRNPSWIRLVEELVSDRFTERIKLPDIAQLAGVHVVHMCREFRRRHGCTIGEFIRRLRVQKASTLLSSSEAPLAEIALNVGCADQSHLSSMFKRQIGMTPGQYRTLFRQN